MEIVLWLVSCHQFLLNVVPVSKVRVSSIQGDAVLIVGTPLLELGSERKSIGAGLGLVESLVPVGVVATVSGLESSSC